MVNAKPKGLGLLGPDGSGSAPYALSALGSMLITGAIKGVEESMSDKFETECPDCGGRVRMSLEDVARQRTVRCSRGHTVKLHDEGGGARRASSALGDLDKALRRFGKS